MAVYGAMSESDILSLLDRKIADAIDYDTSEMAEVRKNALLYADGGIDLPAEEGKSSVVSSDTADALGWIVPAVVRQFTGSDRVFVYEPTRVEAEQAASQASDYVNHVVMNECSGFRVLHESVYDGVLLGNGIVKHWWDDAVEYAVTTHRGLSDDQYLLLGHRDDVAEIVDHTEYPDPDYVPPPMPEPQIGPDGLPVMMDFVPPPPPMLHDLKAKRVVSRGRLRVMAMPPEDFFIDRNAVELTEEGCDFCAHRYYSTRSDLIEKGFDRDIVDRIAADTDESNISGNVARNAFYATGRGESADRSTDRIEVWECYLKLDIDNDGVAEVAKVVAAGSDGADVILSSEPWGEDYPFTDLVPDPIPHRWRGRSIYELTRELARIKTTLLRQSLNNLYATNNPTREVVEGEVISIDELVNQELGVNIFVKRPNVIRDMTIPFTAEKSFPMLDYFDTILEKRTGVSRQSQGLQMDALQNQTAAAVNAAVSSGYLKQEAYARNIAEVGMKRLGKKLLKLIVENQDRPRTIRLKGKFVEMDPRSWDSDLDVSINTGLGTGSRDKDVAALMGIKASQEAILVRMGPNNPLCGLQEYRNTLAKLCEASNIKNVDQFFREVTPEVIQQMMSAPPPPDPKMIEAQGRMQIKTQELQAKAQIDGQKMQMEGMERAARLEADLKHRQELSASESAARIREIELKAQLEQKAMDFRQNLEIEKMNREFALKERELQLQADLKLQQIMAGVGGGANATNIPQATPL